jgi:hypothetical protein
MKTHVMTHIYAAMSPKKKASQPIRGALSSKEVSHTIRRALSSTEETI